MPVDLQTQAAALIPPAPTPREACAEFRIGLRTLPYLADHGFQDMVVLPGSFYVDLAMCLDRGLSRRMPGVVRNASFLSPIILSAQDTVIKVDVRNCGDRGTEYAFYEAGVDDDDACPPNRPHAARLEIDRNPAAAADTDAGAISIEAFQRQARAEIGSERFYATLRANGNQYGPRFQNVGAIWRAGHQSLGKFAVPRRVEAIESHFLHPSLLDSMTQLLAPFVMEEGKTFVLRSIEKIEVMDVDFPETLWGHASLLARSEGGGAIGNVLIFDASGKPYLKLSGVAFSLLDRVDAAGGTAAAQLVIAANFTAEPLEDSLRFWGEHFGAPGRIAFAPYNQVFQQLLDAGSAMRRNRDGVNVVLLGLEEWAAGEQPALTALSHERAGQCFGARQRCVLPNGLEVAHLNRYETDYLYREIFEDQVYLRHGIRLPDAATVVDVGANIGLFSLFVASRCANPTIYAFEPAPLVYDLLKANCDAYGTQVRALNTGLSDRPGTATFTFYEKSSVFSGFHSDEADDREAIQAVVRNMLNRELAGGEPVEDYVRELTAGRLRRSAIECRLTTLSEVIRENAIEKIDLLKIDAEKSELDIIEGIDERDWPKIEQIVIEIHDRSRRSVERVEALLRDKGFRCVVEQESLLEHAGLFNLYATRPGRESGIAASAGHASLTRNTRDFCAALRSFMSQSAVPLVLCFCPRTPAADGDAELKAALDAAEQALSSEARGMTNVRVMGSASITRCYPVRDFHDPHAHQVGHIPYTPQGYAAIGTALVRSIFNLSSSPYKVIVLDCDNTLWRGACAEDGAQGIEIGAPYRALQEFMVGQMNAGMLLCLCSKNNEADVLEVFDRRTDMPLKREHLVAWRINWSSKAENLRSLAAQLGLGPDSFIFIDDNPVECEEVRLGCPGVLALQLPRDAQSIPAFLNHVWAFDHAAATDEDTNRTRMYQEGANRQKYLEQAYSLKDFVKGLQLRVEITEATQDQFGRVSQLTVRTNQFNFTAVRRSESEIGSFLRGDGAHCLVVRAVDRFGDYGLVGVVMYVSQADRYKVDSLLLSCRALGRGVEHALVAQLGRRASNEGKSCVEFAYAPTGRNQPALDFLARIGAGHRSASGTCWTIPADSLARVEYDPDPQAAAGQEAPAPVGPDQRLSRPAMAFGAAGRAGRLQRIAEDLREVEPIARAIEEFRVGKLSLPASSAAAPGGTLEAELAGIWSRVLGRPHIGMNDNFFEAGGNSLKAVQVVAAVRRELKRPLSLVSLFECPTVELLAERLRTTAGAARPGAAASVAALRGQRRRGRTMTRRAA